MSQYYEERFCLFLDILGFQSHIDETVVSTNKKRDAMSFSKLMTALNEISDRVHYRDAFLVSGKIRASSRKVTQFSDSVIVSYLRKESHEGGVMSILMDVHNLQLVLIQRGILLRGAVTVGLLHHDEKLVFGPALNEAVALEKLANYPRVILDGEILDEAGLKRKSKPEYSRTISSMVAEDFDGLYYIDYFNVHPDDFSDDWDDVSSYLENLRALIKGLSNKKSPSIKLKHSWLRTKFNAMASDFQKASHRTLGRIAIPDEDVELFTSIKPF